MDESQGKVYKGKRGDISETYKEREKERGREKIETETDRDREKEIDRDIEKITAT